MELESGAMRHGRSPRLVNGAAGRGHAGIELDLAEGAFVSGDILLQNGHERFGLLRAQIDALKVADLDLGLGWLLHGAEDKEEIPDVDADLNAVGVVFAIIRSMAELDVGLVRRVHANSVKVLELMHELRGRGRLK